MVSKGSRHAAVYAAGVTFAASLLVLMGVIQVVEGLLSVVAGERVVLVANRLIGIDVRDWGWIVLASGLVLTVTGVGLMAARTWARVLAIVIVCLHAVSQVFWLDAAPLWAVLMIALDTAVLWSLTARWSAAGEGLEAYA